MADKTEVITLHPDLHEVRVRTAVEQVEATKRLVGAIMATSETMMKAQWGFMQMMANETLAAMQRATEANTRLMSIGVTAVTKTAQATTGTKPEGKQATA